MITDKLRTSLYESLQDKMVFKKEWLNDMTEEQEELFNELYSTTILSDYGYTYVQIIGLEGKHFIAADRDDYGIYHVEIDSVDLETLEWFINQPSVNDDDSVYIPPFNEEKFAKEILKNRGYFIDNLWQVNDVIKVHGNRFDGNEQDVLNFALTNVATIDQIWFSINDYKYLNE